MPLACPSRDLCVSLHASNDAAGVVGVGARGLPQKDIIQRRYPLSVFTT
jgi:hypothetical protein